MTIIERGGWVLLHFVWQGAVIALGLAILLALTRERRRGCGMPSPAARWR